MAISGIDSIISGSSDNFAFFKTQRLSYHVQSSIAYANLPLSFWYLTGIPCAAPSIACSNSGYVFDTTTGGSLTSWAMPFIQPPPGKSTYFGNLAWFPPGGLQGVNALVCDRIWQSHEFVLTGDATHIIHATGDKPFPARDDTGGSNGLGFLICLEITTAPTGRGVNNKGNSPIVTYTNSNGLTRRTGTHSTNMGGTFNLSTPVHRGTCFLISRATGDLGIQSIQSVRVTGLAETVMGAMSGQLVVFRPIEIGYSNTPYYQISSVGTTLSQFSTSLSRPSLELYSGTTPYIMGGHGGISLTTGVYFGQINYIIA